MDKLNDPPPLSFAGQVFCGTLVCVLALFASFVIIHMSIPPPPSLPLRIAFIALNPLPCLLEWIGITGNSVTFIVLNEIYYCHAFMGVYHCYIRTRPHQAEEPKACGLCDYDLTGNESGTCPECGTPVQQSHDAEGIT